MLNHSGDNGFEFKSGPMKTFYSGKKGIINQTSYVDPHSKTDELKENIVMF